MLEQTSSRLFKNDILERFAHVHPRTPFILYIPVVIYLLIHSTGQVSPMTMVVLFLMGILDWTLAEYLLHRYVFHMQPTSEWGKKVAYLIHYVHHDHPEEEDRLVMPPMGSIPFAVVIILLHYQFLGVAGLVHFAGFLTGYLYYDFVHYAVHASRVRWGWFKTQKKHHLLHHFKDETKRFGVSSPLWDYVFGTDQ